MVETLHATSLQEVKRGYRMLITSPTIKIARTQSKKPNTAKAAITKVSLLSSEDSLRIEPPNWWIDMAHNTVELLVRSTKIKTMLQTYRQKRLAEEAASIEVSIPYPDVVLKKVNISERGAYIFLTLEIKSTAEAGTMPINFSDGTTRFTYEYPLFARIMPKGFSMKDVKGFTSADAMYLITPDRFANGDESNDKIPTMRDTVLNRKDKDARHGGDIAGIRKRLRYIKDLGFTSIWICPMLENNMTQTSYHGYAITDFYKIDPRFGTNEDYKALCTEANKIGLKIINDMVVNHCGLEHWWMKELPADDWINFQSQPYTETNHQKSVFVDPYATELDKKNLTEGWFVPTMPDLNQRNPNMARYLIQNSIWWIEYAGLSGIRMDTYPYSDKTFMANWSKAIMTEYPNFNIVGEIWHKEPSVTAYWQRGKVNSDGYESHLKTLMDFALQRAVVQALTEPRSYESSWQRVYELLAQDFLYANPQDMLIFLDNHDMSRVFTQLKENLQSYKLAITLLLTMRGIPQVYYGTEILQVNRQSEDHGVIRGDFPGGWKQDAVNAFEGKGLTTAQKEARDFLKRLLNWRKNQLIVQQGRFMHFAPSAKDDCYVYFRYLGKKSVMVVLNNHEQVAALQTDRFAEILKGAKTGKDVLSGKTVNLINEFEVPAKSAMVIEVGE
ncbi:hypothetical protein CHS0354_024073 [Potamilus streckersoni]|uniref:Glycosyl hydrolase family 13 catalytic domain-containing protein n=1 Tax=Potamilus streckersoni TaxID=2493646 RepID=A0AAE0VLC1_9BIVA|nr:hypothetical protein CHS0354_024073 [Potamilus streckersoni]